MYVLKEDSDAGYTTVFSSALPPCCPARIPVIYICLLQSLLTDLLSANIRSIDLSGVTPITPVCRLELALYL